MTTIAHISDLHFGTEDSRVLEALHRELDGRTAVVAISGDLTQRARTAEFRAARRFLDGLPIPHVVVPGNHDVPLYNVVRRLVDPLGAYRDHITDNLAPTYADDTVAIAGIATAHGLTIKGGKVTAAQIDAATQSLAAADTPWKVIVAHHPFVGPDAELVHAAAEALAAFRRAGVDMILTGHLHRSFSGDAAHRDEAHRIIAVHAGTCISQRTRGEPNSYNRITFAGDDVTVLVRTWNGSAFVDAARKAYRRTALLPAQRARTRR